MESLTLPDPPVRVPLECEIVHAVPGRIRVRISQLGSVNGYAQAFVRHFQAQPGILSVRVNTTCGSAVINYDPKVLAVKDSVRLLKARVEHMPMPRRSAGRPRNEVDGLPPLVMSSLFFGTRLLGLPFSFAAWNFLGIVSSMPIFTRALKAILMERRLNVDVLDAAAAGILMGRGDHLTAGFMIWLISLGEYIRETTARRSRRLVTDAMMGQQRWAWAVRNGKKRRIAIEDLAAGETIVVYPGESVPVDGVVTEGRAMVDQKSLTGESMPVERTAGDKVFATTVVSDGKLYLVAEHVGMETRAARIVQLIESAPLQETRVENYAARIADRLVLPAFGAAGISWLVTRDVGRMLPFVIVDFGTGLRVAAPTAVLSSIIHATRRGILFKSGRSLEKLAQVDTVVFDKTGTLTEGAPKVVDVISVDSRFTADEVLALCASAEARLNHPAAHAITRHAEAMHLKIPERSSSEYVVGMGVAAQVNGYLVRVGSPRFMTASHIHINGVSRQLAKFEARALSPLLVSVDKKVVGLITYADPLRPESAEVVQKLRELGVKQVVLLTGDNRHVAAAIAAQAKVDQCIAEVFPEDKVRVVQDLQARGHCVAFVGDGINDSPALAYADVAVCVKEATDIAQETADVMLMHTDLNKLVEAVKIARNGMRLIQQNIHLVMWPNAAAIVGAVMGVIGPAAATLVSNGSTILAGLNGMRPAMGYKPPPPAAAPTPSKPRKK